MDKILINAIKKEKFYLGVSAGSIIAGPDIEVANLGDPNDINLQDSTGLKLVPYIITPHYNQKEEDDVKNSKKSEKASE